MELRYSAELNSHTRLLRLRNDGGNAVKRQEEELHRERRGGAQSAQRIYGVIGGAVVILFPRCVGKF